jgi:hypothetical protein
MGAPSPKPDWNMSAYQNAYQAAQRGAPWGAVEQTFSGRNAPFLEAGRAGFNAGRPMKMPEFHMPAFHMPSMPDFGAQMEAMRAQSQQSAAAAQQAQADARRQEEERLRNQYMDMARTNVADRLTADASRARLIGMEYTPPDVGSKEYEKLVEDEFTKLYGTRSQSLIGGTDKVTTGADAKGRKSLIMGVNKELEDEDELSTKALLGA